MHLGSRSSAVGFVGGFIDGVGGVGGVVGAGFVGSRFIAVGIGGLGDGLSIGVGSLGEDGILMLLCNPRRPQKKLSSSGRFMSNASRISSSS